MYLVLYLVLNFFFVVVVIAQCQHAVILGCLATLRLSHRAAKPYNVSQSVQMKVTAAEQMPPL